MFGFLKQKLADFGNKLKDTVTKEEETKAKTEEKKETKPTDQTKEDEKTEQTQEKKPNSLEKNNKTIEQEKQSTKKETKTENTPKAEETKEKTETKAKEITLTTKKDETKTTEKKESTTKTEVINTEKEKTENKTIQKEIPQKTEKKKGLFGRLFGGGKKEEKNKKTKEEEANELERKLFKDIEAELKEEGQTETIEEESLLEIDNRTNKQNAESEKEDKTEKQHQEENKSLEITEEANKTLEIENKEKEIKNRTQKQEGKEKIQTPQVKPIIENKILNEKESTEVNEDKETNPETSEEEDEVEKEEEIKEEKEIEEENERIERPRDIHIKTLEEDKRELHANVGVNGKLKGFIFGGIELTEKDVTDLVFELELSLIESDVEQDAASEIANQIKKRLVGKKVSAKNIDDFLKEQIKEILAEMMKTEKIDVLQMAKQHKPFKILVLGPNGAGKTTSIAKLVHYFQKHNLSCILAAGDTFRAGAIDQIEEHAKKLGVRIVKQQYGADPAAVAFDAIKAAEAAKIDVVIMDSAGRQETNKNLMEELRKLERVAKPDLKIYVGEAYVGQGLLEQAEEFKEIIGIDGFILTKIDTDAKGGTAISLIYKMKKPIIFVGTGQGYDDLEEFTPEFILERII